MLLYYDPETRKPLYTVDGDLDNAPTGTCIEISPDETPDHLNAYEVVDGVLTEVSLEPKRASALQRINEIIREARLRFITDLPGQEMMYSDKEREAALYVASDPEPVDLTDFPWISQEVGITAPTAYEVAQVYLNMGAQWRQVGAIIEGYRMTASTMIGAAADKAAIDQALANLEASLLGLPE